MLIATVIKLTLPIDEMTVAVVLELLDESTGEKGTATISAHIIKLAASMDRVPVIGDKFNLNIWKLIQ